MVTFASVEQLIVKIINKLFNPIPSYATVGLSGLDLKAFPDLPITVKPLQTTLIPSGLFLALPVQYEAGVGYSG